MAEGLDYCGPVKTSHKALSSSLLLCLPFNYFILQNFVQLLDVTLSTYLSFYLTGLCYLFDKF